MSERYVVLGLAHPRAEWFPQVASWANGGLVPVEFVKCVSVAEVRARLGSSRPHSAVLLDGTLPAIDRDLLGAVTAAGATPMVVDAAGRDWQALGAAAVLSTPLAPEALLAVLSDLSRPLARVEHSTPAPGPSDGAGRVRSGRLVAVTGPGGTGASSVAIAVAQHLAPARRVLLADLALHADQAMLHDARDVVPGVPELVDAHRTLTLAPDAVHGLTFDVPSRGYRLLLGTRRHRDWTALRRRAVDAALASLVEAFAVVVADVDGDLEGEAVTGSSDVEDRNHLARSVVGAADVVVVVGRASMKGAHSLVRVVSDVLDHGVDPARVLPVLNESPRSPKARAELSRAVGVLLTANPAGPEVAASLHLPHRSVDSALRDGAPLPSAVVRPVGAAVDGLLQDLPLAGSGIAADLVPEPVAPGSLGHWTDDEEDQR